MGSIFKLSMTYNLALVKARGWARLILDRRRVPSLTIALLQQNPPPDEDSQERHDLDQPTSHSRGAFHHGEAAVELICVSLYF